ncbi:hypothetical protein [Gordonia aurantiaca]|uniref:hypothetical protein n=1 Tax=Gordonia sp. B21 TaxID=3151852 RepID=UPI0032642FA2
MGYGTARPSQLSLNSLCANTIVKVTWSSWGGPQAEGRGVMCAYAGDPDTGGAVRLTAGDLGDCHGRLAYRELWIDGRPGWKVC